MKLILFLFLLTSTVIAQQTINDLTAKKFQVVSTTAGSKPCPLMTETQRNAIGSPLNGQCIYNTTTSKLNVYNGTIWKAAGGGVDAWQTASVYAIGDLVIESNKIYQCLIAHTSGVFATDLAALKWTEISVGASDHNSLSGLQLSNAAVTYGHVDDQAQSIFGVKTFNSTISGSINGNASTVTTNANSTGDVTSIGNATTYNGIVPIAKGGTNLSTIGTETKTLKVVSGALAYAEEDRSNLLLNPNFEWATLSDWTCTSGTCTSTNTNGEFSEGLRALKINTTGIVNVSQTILTTSGIQKQGVAGLIYKLPTLATTANTFKICTLIDGVEQSCALDSKLIRDNLYHSIEIPIVFGSTSAGIILKNYTGVAPDTYDVFIDGAYIKQGIGYQNLMLDNVYSAKISPTGVVSEENKDFINGNCALASGDYQCTFNTGIFTVVPNVIGSASDTSSGYTAEHVTFYNVSAATFTYKGRNGANAESDPPIVVYVQKSGNDYLAASSNVYSQASGNYDWTSYTPTFTGLGTVSPSTNQCKHRRIGGDLEVNCFLTIGTTSAVVASVSMPPGLLIDSAKIIANNTTSAAGQAFGAWAAPGAQEAGYIISATGTSASLMYFTAQFASATKLTPANGNGIITSTTALTLNFKVPIAGWSNAAQIVGSFSGYTSLAGASGSATPNVETFKVSYGATVSTVCSSGACAYLNSLVGTPITSITRASVGTYTVLFARAYVSVKCTGQFVLPTSAATMNPLIASNTNTGTFITLNTASGSGADTYGTIDCIGVY